jgi:hypothetical protein
MCLSALCLMACSASEPQVPIAGLPPVSRGVAMAYMPDIDRVVLFGGSFDSPYPDRGEYKAYLDSSRLSGQTWTWDNTEGWRALDIEGPPPRAYAQMAYDPVRHELILFAGLAAPGPDCPEGNGDSGFCQDLWSFDGTQWRRLGAYENLGRIRHMMAWSEDLQGMVVAGGLHTEERYAPLTPILIQGDVVRPLGPQYSEWVSMHSGTILWHPEQRTLLLMHGQTDFGCANGDRNRSLFEWSDDHWRLLQPGRGLGRSSTATFFDRQQGVIVSVGGLEDSKLSYCDHAETVEGTWILSAEGWQLQDIESLPMRTNPGLAYDTLRQRAVLFGGYEGRETMTTELQDTWTWEDGRWTQK